MSREVEPILVTRQETIILPRAKPTVVEDVPVAIKVKYSERRFNQQSKNIIRGVPRDWSRRIHSVNKIPRPNPPHCTYCH
jgi:hypothetical protein